MSSVCIDIGNFGDNLGHLSPTFGSYADQENNLSEKINAAMNQSAKSQITTDKAPIQRHANVENIEQVAEEVIQLGKMLAGFNPLSQW